MLVFSPHCSIGLAETKLEEKNHQEKNINYILLQDSKAMDKYHISYLVDKEVWLFLNCSGFSKRRLLYKK